MKKVLLVLVLLGMEKALHAQTPRTPYIYKINADSVLITNSCDTAELIIENHTQTVPGFLYNKGRGRTEFRRVLQNVSDNTFLIGGDTMKLPNMWLQGGNRFGTIGKFGTLDDNPIDIYTNNIKRGRWTNTGKLFINDEVDMDFYVLQVGGGALFRGGAVMGTDEFKISLSPYYDYGGYDGPKICFGAVKASIGVNKRDYGIVPSGSLLIGQTAPWHITAMVDYHGNPTYVTDGGGWVYINGGYSGIDSGGKGVTPNASAPTFKIFGGRGTGTGTPGDINFYTGKRQPSGNTVHNMEIAQWVIKGESGFLTNVPGVNPDPSSALDITSDNGYSQLRLRKSYTPTSRTDPNGNVGDLSWDENYFYIKTAAGWRRIKWEDNF